MAHVLILSFFVIGVVSFIQFTQYESDMELSVDANGNLGMALSVNANGNLEMVNGSYADITKMSIRGCNGNLIEIRDKDEINALINCISGFSYTETPSLEGRRGWDYLIDFYNGRHRISRISIMNFSNESHAQINGVHYTPNEPGFESCVSDRYWDDLYGSEPDKHGLD
ncbi:hypothetical protein [Methanococcoides sp. NM1]|uniref:hypothetical protein n=1 Tax=Methanococcoides sp. NM1 TaxID=1201013 RepID=UPI00108383FC|nr:hypothetical protein [Methanococcoides sp. NM1]